MLNRLLWMPLLSLHHWSTTTHPVNATSHASLHVGSHTTLTFSPSDWLHLVDGHMVMIHMLHFPFLATPCMPSHGPTNHESLHHVVRHLLYLCFRWALCSLSCLPFIYNLPVFTIPPQFYQNTSFPQISDFIHLPCFTSHCPTVPLSLPVTPCPEMIPHPHIAPSEPHRIYTLIASSINLSHILGISSGLSWLVPCSQNPGVYPNLKKVIRSDICGKTDTPHPCLHLFIWYSHNHSLVILDLLPPWNLVFWDVPRPLTSSIDWLWFGSWTFQTWFEAESKP